MTIATGRPRMNQYWSQNTEDRFGQAFDRLKEKYPEASDDLDALFNAVCDGGCEIEDGAVRLHGRQIMAMIEGSLFQFDSADPPAFYPGSES